MAFGDFDPDNPIDGTHLDPRRQAYLRMQQAGGPDLSYVGTADPGEGSDVGFQPSSSEAAPLGTAAAIAASSGGPAPEAEAVSTRNPAALDEDTSAAQGGAIGRLVRGTVNPVGNGSTPNSSGGTSDDGVDSAFMRAMTNGMDDAPSRARIDKLQGRVDQLQQPLSTRQKILKVLIEAAPMLIAGASGAGLSGVGGAAGGASEAENMLHERGEKTLDRARTDVEQERQRGERQYERRLQLPIAMGNLALSREFKRRTLGINQQNADSRGVTAAAATTRANTGVGREQLAWYAKGLDPNTHQPISEDQLPAAVRSQLALNTTRQGLMDAQTELTNAKTKKIPFDIAIAQQRASQAKDAHDIQRRTFYRDTYGIDPETDEPITGSPLDDKGNVLGWKAAANVKPSGMEQSRAGQGEVIKTAGDHLIQTIGTHKNKIGDVGAILNNAFLGTPISDPESASIASEIGSFAALQPALHGFRGQDALNEFAKMIGGLPKNPDALVAAIKSIQGTAGIMAEHGKMKTVGSTRDNRPVGAAGKLKKPAADSGGGGATHEFVPGRGIVPIGAH